MSAAKITKPAYLRGRLDRIRHNALERGLTHLLPERLHHRMSGLPDGDYYDPRIRLEIVKILADAQHSTLTMHMPRKPRCDRSFSQRAKKNLTGGIPHLKKDLSVVHTRLAEC
jgi:hypothetical protein